MEQIIVDDQLQIPSKQNEAKAISLSVTLEPDSCKGSTHHTKALGCLLLVALFAVRMYRDASQPIIKILMKDEPVTLFRSMLPIRSVLLVCWFTMALIQYISVKSCIFLNRNRNFMDIITLFLLLVSVSCNI
jgi:hypothetical protein